MDSDKTAFIATVSFIMETEVSLTTPKTKKWQQSKTSLKHKNTTKKPPMTLTSGKDFVRPSEKYESWNTFQQPIPKSSCAIFLCMWKKKDGGVYEPASLSSFQETFKDTLRTKIPH